MRHARSGGHVLEVTWLDDAPIAHRILMFERPGEDITDDFHIAMRMRAKPAATGDFVIVDHPQRAETHPLRIIIVREGEGVVTIQPAMVGVASFVCFSDRHHGYMMPSL